MKAGTASEIQRRLQQVLEEIRQQSQLSHLFGGDILSFEEHIEQLTEYLDVAGEYGIAYESMIAMLERAPFLLSSKAAIGLLEVALLFGFKTERPEDQVFDLRGQMSGTKPIETDQPAG